MFAFFAFLTVAMFHADHALESFVMEMLENAPIIDLSGVRFLAARIVTRLEVPNLTPTHVNVRDQVAFGDLLMIDVK